MQLFKRKKDASARERDAVLKKLAERKISEETKRVILGYIDECASLEPKAYSMQMQAISQIIDWSKVESEMRKRIEALRTQR